MKEHHESCEYIKSGHHSIDGDISNFNYILRNVTIYKRHAVTMKEEILSSAKLIGVRLLKRAFIYL